MRTPDKLTLGHTVVPKGNYSSEKELEEYDQELLGVAALAWALMVSHLPSEIINEFSGGLAETGVPSLFSASIPSGSMCSYFLCC